MSSGNVAWTVNGGFRGVQSVSAFRCFRSRDVADGRRSEGEVGTDDVEVCD